MIRNIVRNIRAKSATALPKDIQILTQEIPSNVERPLLSVVVPCYKVEKYLAATLETILSQKNVDLEIIVVDDGSPDKSGDIARRFAESDSRIQVVTQQNSGLGAARNTGIRLASGQYLTFADSDDYIPSGAYSSMVEQLEKSGNDFVVGSVERRHGLKTWIPEWAQAVHKVDKTGAVLGDDVEILKDVFAWNKVFRRSFWDEHIGKFPVNVRYEDQGPTAIAYTKSQGFDVLNKVVYTWVIREDGTSITQQKARIEDLADRLDVMSTVSSILQENSTKGIHKDWIIKSIGFDLKPYYDQTTRVNTAYWNLLSDGVKTHSVGLTAEDWKEIPFWDRLMAFCLLWGTSDDVGIVQAARQEYGLGYALRFDSNNNLCCFTDFLGDLSFVIDEDLLASNVESIRLNSEVLGSRWINDFELEISGAAWLSGLSPDNFEYSMSGTFVSSDVSSSIPVAISQTMIDPNRLTFNDSYNDYSECGFVARIDIRDTPIPSDRSNDISWQLNLTVTAAGVERTSPISRRSILGSAASFGQGALFEGSRVAVRFEEARGLVLNLPTLKPVVTHAGLIGRKVSLQFDASTCLEFDRVLLRSKHHRDLSFVAAERNEEFVLFNFEIPITDDTLVGSALWEVRLANRHKSCVVQYGDSTRALEYVMHAGSRTRFDLSPNGFLRIAESDFALSISGSEFIENNDLLRINGEIDSPHQSGIRLFFEGPSSAIIEPIELVFDRGNRTFSAIFSLFSVTNEGVPFAYPEGGYALKASRTGSLIGAGDVWVPVEASLQKSLPHYADSEFSRVRLSRTKQAAALWMNLYPPRTVKDLGPFNQRRMIRANSADMGTLQDATLFESFGGSSISDSPLALFEYARSNSLGGKLFWTVRDRTITVPEGATPLLIHSEKYHEILNSAMVLINNNNFPHYFRKKKNQLYVQTWHGTPLKRIGRHVPKANLSVSYRRLMEREALSWDALIAQNSFAAEKLTEAFGYSGEVWNLGYPRNDVLTSSSASTSIKNVRSGLGISPKQHVVLYAPTWRDNVRTASSHYDLVSHLDFSAIYKEFGDSVIILMRGHSNTVKSNRSFNDSNVIDVSNYPDINDLILISDSLITDYSSIMFDYSVTGKPILILAPDIDEYESSTRGFYYDFRKDLPGPLLSTTREVVDILKSGLLNYVYRANKYRSTFAPNDDGVASSRIAKLIWTN